MFDPNLPGIMVLQSGGIDSATCLYVLLTETDIPIHSFHIRMTDQHSAAFEWAAVYKQWEWLKTNTRSFTTSVGEAKRKSYDIHFAESIGPVVAEEFSKLEGFGKIIPSKCREDDENMINAGVENRFANRLNVTWEPIVGRSFLDFRIHSPTAHLYKSEMASLLPSEYLKLIWGCQTPLSASMRPCGKCSRCIQYEKAGIFEDVYGISYDKIIENKKYVQNQL